MELSWRLGVMTTASTSTEFRSAAENTTKWASVSGTPALLLILTGPATASICERIPAIMKFCTGRRVIVSNALMYRLWKTWPGTLTHVCWATTSSVGYFALLDLLRFGVSGGCVVSRYLAWRSWRDGHKWLWQIAWLRVGCHCRWFWQSEAVQLPLLHSESGLQSGSRPQQSRHPCPIPQRQSLVVVPRRPGMQCHAMENWVMLHLLHDDQRLLPWMISTPFLACMLLKTR